MRGTVRYAIAEGVRLAAGDIVHTGEKAFTRLEFANGSRVDLGPRTYLLTPATPAARGAKSGGGELYLLSGLIKFTAEKSANASYRYATPHFAVMTSNGVAVVQLTAKEAALFLESGEASLAESEAKGASAPQRLKTGDFYTRKSGQRSAIAPRPSRDFVEGLPRGFLDTIPSRLARFKDREVPPKRLDEITYADVEVWLKTSRTVRRPLVQRWQSKAHDPAFRNALIANLKEHPEWDPILFPEKYKPKEEKPPAVVPSVQ